VAKEVSKALRRTEPPEVLRGQLVNYDDTDREMRASLEFYTALRGRVFRVTRLSPKGFKFYTGYRGKGLFTRPSPRKAPCVVVLGLFVYIVWVSVRVHVISASVRPGSTYFAPGGVNLRGP
jgi:hypothetical protein